MMGYGGYGYGMMGYGWGWIMMLGTLVLIVLAAAALYKYQQRTGKDIPFAGNNAINILNEKYAKGEITEEEYRRKKAEIKS